MTIPYLMLSLLVVIGLLRIAAYFLADWLLMTRPLLPPMYAWQFSTDHCQQPMARPLDPETLGPVDDWRAMPRFSGMMRVENGLLFARDPGDEQVTT